VILAVLHTLPLPVVVFIFIFALIFDPESLRIDYALLATIFSLFIVSDYLSDIIKTILPHTHIFALSTLLSQIISNVPATLLLAKITPHWEALLWGVNAGGFGLLIGSLANLIAYRFYVRTFPQERSSFALRFSLLNLAALFVAVAWYYLLHM
jgi:Na+/H+ antiporter NhaD/arsenite permease-like protein